MLNNKRATGDGREEEVIEGGNTKKLQGKGDLRWVLKVNSI